MRIFACMASTLDGKIGPADATSFVSITSPTDMEHLKKVRDQADGILFGAETYRTWPKVHRGTNTEHNPHHFILSRSLDLPLNTPLMEETNIPVTVFSSNPQKGQAGLLNRLNIVGIPEGPAAIVQICEDIASRGVQSLLIEGGGIILNQFIQAGLLEELYLTLSPRIMGDPSAPGLLGDTILNAKVSTEILSCRQKGNELYLHLKLNDS